MKKLRLDPEELAVEPFETTPEEPEERGTVHGHDTRGCPTPDTYCNSPSYDCTNYICTFESCDHTCRCMTNEDCNYTT
jgi:hypothetical protein